eukprot:TRINITY_DN4541_c0_g1_i1.p1 TRINITY_DN4541_c0_g1~~TRINITY_DN4541_c0_g1_i1.p1  ORF type:complete len:133 (+),score=38.82 TRINITY_DN4541_c0_g1_i1:85-483(+)
MARPLLFVVVLLLVVALAKTNPPPKQTQVKSAELFEMFQAECAVQCMNEVKNEEMCVTFCEWVNSVQEAMTRVTRMYNSFGRPKDAIEWAMIDTVQDKMKTKHEDDGETARFFLQALRKWGSYVEAMRMREL